LLKKRKKRLRKRVSRLMPREKLTELKEKKSKE